MTDEYSVLISSPARAQLADIVRYIRSGLQSPYAASAFLRLMESEILSLAQLPRRFALTPEEPWRSEGVRRMPVKGYLVYYWIDEPRRAVHVIAVIYARRSQREALQKTAQ